MLEPDAGSAAVFIDEFYAGVFEGALDLPDIRGVPLHWSIIAFHPPNRRQGEAGCICNIRLIPAQEPPSTKQLRYINHLTGDYI